MRQPALVLVVSALLFAPSILAQTQTTSSAASDSASATVSTSVPNALSGAPPQEKGWVPRPRRDANAVSVVQASLAALGGAAAIGQVQNCVVQAQVQAAASSPYPSGTMVWEVSGAERKSTFTGSQGTVIQSSGNGQAFSVKNGTSSRLPWHELRASFYPALAALTLLDEFQDLNYSLEYQGTANINTMASTGAGSGANPEAVTVVKISSQATVVDSLVTPQTWYFSNATNLPLRVEYHLPDSKHVGKFVLATVDLSQYQSISGVLYPFQIALSIVGNQMNVASVSSVTPNANLPSTEFANSTGGGQ